MAQKFQPLRPAQHAVVFDQGPSKGWQQAGASLPSSGTDLSVSDSLDSHELGQTGEVTVQKISAPGLCHSTEVTK